MTTKGNADAVVHSIKGFDANLQCRGFQFEPGQTYTVTGKIKACENGFHACPVEEHPLSVLSFYQPAGSRFFEVTQGGNTSRDDTKLASATLTVGIEITLGDLAMRAVKWVFDRADWKNAVNVTGKNEGATATGDQGASTATGDQGASTATGYQGASTATGDQGASTATGTRGASTATGTRGASTATGYQGASTATGDQGASTATGYQGASTAGGKYCGAYSAGHFGKVRGVDGSALHLDERIWNPGADDHGKIITVWAGIVGQDGIKPDTFYTLVDGKPVEADQ